jgi:hypothetical protein
MSFTSPLDVEVTGRGRTRSIWTGAIITSACVAAGVALATATLPAVPTPTNVAIAYTEARFAHDWPTTWDLLCGPTHAAMGGYAAFAEGVAHLDEYVRPTDVDVSVGDVHGVRGASSPFATVAVTVTSVDGTLEDWETSGELFIVEEDGEFRVCQDGLWDG